MTLVDADTGEIIAPLTPDEARTLTDRIREHVAQAWELLTEAHDRMAFKALGYSSFAEYVTGEFDMSRRHAYRLLDQGRVIRELERAAGVTHGSHAVSVSEREARDIKPHLDAVQQEIKDRIDSGEDPAAAIRTTITTRRSEPRTETVKGHLSSVTTEPEAPPSVGDVEVIVPWSFKKELTPHEPQIARDAAGYFDAKVIKNPDLWHKHLDNFPARLRGAALVEAKQQAAHWNEAVRRLSRTAGPRSA